MATHTLVDKEFGEIRVRRTRTSRRVSIRIGTDGRYQATAPLLTPLIFIRRMIDGSRSDLRKLAEHSSVATPYIDGQLIGTQHRLAVVATGMVKQPESSVTKQRIIIKLPDGHQVRDKDTQQLIRDTVIKVLRKEAKLLLPTRLKQLAVNHGFHYEKIRFSHSSGRWGSCTSGGTISLNIALMKLPDELIQYVLVHELCHTRQMNHSVAFWNEVKKYDPHYLLHRRQIKKYTPTV
jgi:predicted metal-dependent hydrolase